MPTDCERSITSPTTVQASAKEIKDNLTSLTALNEDLMGQNIMVEGDMSTSQTSTTSNGSSSCNGARKTSITSPDPTAYVAKARVTRPTPPPPPYNPMQFVQIKPCNLYQTAQEQLKKAEEVKKIKEIRKEEPEDWQNNLDNWKSSRRKRVEHIIDRVVEVKKLELEEHDRTRRKSKTFSEMIEERGERSGGRGLNKLASLAVYAEDEANDLSDLGIGTSSASGKSSLSEDYDNNSVMSDNAAELDKAITNSSTHHKPATTESTTREYISSPGYETSSSTAPASSPDPCEYTYEGAIQDYKQRVSRAASGLTSAALNKLSASNQHYNSKESTPERPLIKETAYPPRRGSKIEDRLMGFEVQSPSEECVEKNKVDVPKIDISKRKEIFESHDTQSSDSKSQLAGGATNNNAGVPRVTLRDRFKVQETAETLTEQPKKELRRLSGDITSIKERLQSLEQQQNLVNGANGATKTTANKLVDIPVPRLKERLSSLQNAVTKEEVRKPPVVLVDARQLEIMKSEDEKAQQTLKEVKQDVEMKVMAKIEEKPETSSQLVADDTKSDELDEGDRNDSGIHTADDVELEERVHADILKKEQELKLNAAIEALAKEEKQLSEAANAVNQIEAEFEELSLGSVAALPPLASNSNATATAPITNEHMEYSVSSTNPQEPSTCSNNYNNNEISSDNGSFSQSSGNGTSSNNMVAGLDFKTASNLRRKPTNEMVHAKNLLKIFKETFQNDIELDEDEVSEEHEIKNVKENVKPQQETALSLNIKTQVFQNSKNQNPHPPYSPQTIVAKEANAAPPSVHSPLAASMIPRPMTPLGKPPMSPITIRSTSKFIAATPPGSPSLNRKNDSQFSINGRVEIFNSKTMTTSLNSSNFAKPTTPTMTAKKSQLPYISAPKAVVQSNNIMFPNQLNHQQQQQLPQEGNTNKQQHTNTVIGPLSATSLAATTKKSEQQQQQHHRTDDDGNNDVGKIEQLKSMPLQKMANEPHANRIDKETYHQHPANHNSEAVKQQQQQQPEVVLCAPPITIVNPDELPKPNTVKNLSSCFQQQQQQDSGTPKRIPPKPLPRTRIPSSPLLRETKLSPVASSIEEEKKLSVISSGSTSSSSASTNSTVIDNSKKLSILSDTSTISDDVAPTLLKTSAQVHKEPQGEVTESFTIKSWEEAKEKPNKLGKTLDKAATQALVQEMIRAESQARTLILNAKDTKPKTDKTPEPNITHPTPKEIFLQNSSGKFSSPQFTALQPFTTPLQPFKSPEAETMKTFASEEASQLCGEHQPNNQGSPLAPLKPRILTEVSGTVASPPSDCPPNESSLHKLTSSVPPSPGSNLENNLALDAAICNNLLTSLAVTPELMQRQHTVEEDLCQKIDKESLPFNQGTTGFKDISKADIKHCDGITPSAAPKLQVATQRQKTVEEELCQKVDISTLPDDKKHQPTTGFKCVSPTEIRKCDNFFATGSEKPSPKPSNSKPNSPIVEARAAHSKALIETCEKIIAEERLASSQLKCSLPSSSPATTPLMQRKSKIPKPIPSCCKATESLDEADLKVASCSSPTKEDNKNGAIARLHVVETQIKVTTTSPPASPKVPPKPQASPQPNKKTKNIFDFLKKNFGVGSNSHKEESSSPEAKKSETSVNPSQDNKVLVLSEEELQTLEKVKYDEVHKFDNSKFYIPTSEMDDESTAPPPLPKTPAPVNIEITRKIITNEILEGDKTEKDLTKEIDDLLDDELNKLNHEIEELEKVGGKQ